MSRNKAIVLLTFGSFILLAISVGAIVFMSDFLMGRTFQNIGWLIVNGCAYTACFGILMRILYRKSWELKDLLDRAKGFLAGRR